MHSEQPISQRAVNTHPKLTICTRIHINKRVKRNKNAPVKCLSFASARVPVSASISVADMPCKSSTVCVSKGFLAPLELVDWTSGFHRAGDVEKERKTVCFGRKICRRNNALAIVVVVVEDAVCWCRRRKSAVAVAVDPPSRGRPSTQIALTPPHTRPGPSRHYPWRRVRGGSGFYFCCLVQSSL